MNSSPKATHVDLRRLCRNGVVKALAWAIMIVATIVTLGLFFVLIDLVSTKIANGSIYAYVDMGLTLFLFCGSGMSPFGPSEKFGSDRVSSWRGPIAGLPGSCRRMGGVEAGATAEEVPIGHRRNRWSDPTAGGRGPCVIRTSQSADEPDCPRWSDRRRNASRASRDTQRMSRRARLAG